MNKTEVLLSLENLRKHIKQFEIRSRRDALDFYQQGDKRMYDFLEGKYQAYGNVGEWLDDLIGIITDLK